MPTDLADWVIAHYPEDIFTPLSKRERDILLGLLENSIVPSAPERLHAEWARHLGKVYEHYRDQE